MSKSRQRSSKYLKLLAEKVHSDIKDVASKLLNLYEQGNIKQVVSAESMMDKLSSTNKKTRDSAKRKFEANAETWAKYKVAGKKPIESIKRK